MTTIYRQDIGESQVVGEIFDTQTGLLYRLRAWKAFPDWDSYNYLPCEFLIEKTGGHPESVSSWRGWAALQMWGGVCDTFGHDKLEMTSPAFLWLSEWENECRKMKGAQ